MSNTKPLLPNAKTIEAMKAARRGELISAGSPEDLLKKLSSKAHVPRSTRRRPVEPAR
jgi:hypothetical protein